MRRALLIAIASLAIISPAHAGEVTVTERAAEECEGASGWDCYGAWVRCQTEGDFICGDSGAFYQNDEPMNCNWTPLEDPCSAPEEDEPGWDCHTMGNKLCGPTPLTELPRTL